MQMKLLVAAVFVLFFMAMNVHVYGDDLLPVVINTWPFIEATEEAMDSLKSGGTYLDAVEKGCSKCETLQCDGSVGYGGSPDELGNTTLDAMIMDGVSHDVGSVGCLKRVKSAISVARAVMEYSEHTLLVGKDEVYGSLGKRIIVNPTTDSKKILEQYYYQNTPRGHDTIGMIVIDKNGNMAAGTTTNGASHKIPGRVGDSPIAGAGAYVDNNVGGAACTGDGDVMMRFLPSYQAVEYMRNGLPPKVAADNSLRRILTYYPSFHGGIIVINKTGHYGAAAHGFSPFPFTVYNPELGKPTVFTVKPIDS